MARTIRSLFPCHTQDWVSDICPPAPPPPQHTHTQFPSLRVSVSCPCLLQKSPAKVHPGRRNDWLYYCFRAAACVLFPLGAREEIHSHPMFFASQVWVCEERSREAGSTCHPVIKGGDSKRMNKSVPNSDCSQIRGGLVLALWSSPLGSSFQILSRRHPLWTSFRFTS